MRVRTIAPLACLALIAFSSGLSAQSKPSKQKPDHTGDLSGVWYPSSVNTFNFIWTDAQGQRLSALPLTPWGQEKFKANHPIGEDYTMLTSNEPKFSCLPPGVPDIYTNAYPVELIQIPGRVIMFFEFGHFVRQIFTDGRGHPKDTNPTWMGDSVGKWEGDTLVVDSTGFNDQTWLDVSGHPHSETMHLVERMRRVNHDTLLIDIAIDDPQAYTGTLKTQRKFILKPGWNIMEYICEDSRVRFSEFEKKVGAPGKKTADVAVETGASQSVAGEWKGTIFMADARSFPAAANFSTGSAGTIAVADPSGSFRYEFQNVSVAASGTITAVTGDGTNLIGKLSSDGKQISGDIVLASGTGHKITLSRP